MQTIPYLERNGTALSKFKMNQASVLEAGLNDTRGGVGACPEKTEFDLCFLEPGGVVEATARCANDDASRAELRGPAGSQSEFDALSSLIVSYSEHPFHIMSPSRKVNDEELSRFRRPPPSESALCWSKRMVPAVPVGATRSSQPSGRADVWTT